ncbi:MAG: hypothetical protein Q8R90_05255 [Bacteroidales bacterium]|jgi:uncharacterized protein YcfL|nr:hypothetical protein [Bacteroidales bacterium]
MKKLFVLFVAAGFALTSCGSGAEKAQEEVVEVVTDSTAVAADSTACCPDSTKVEETVVE